MSDDGSLISNTHQFVKKLIAAGMPEAQAEAQMEIFIHFIDDKLATKNLVKNSELALRKDIKELEKDIKELENSLKKDIKIMEKEITIKLGGMIVLATTVLGILIKIL